jgi:hypothetical protein
MVTEDEIINTVMLRYRLGTFLIWLGVFTWAPFIFLRVIGEKPQLLYFLPFHLLGVIGGSRLRGAARRELGILPPRKSILLIAGHIMIFLGILVWTPYLYLKLVLGQPVDAMLYLPYHLTGILGGVMLHALNYTLTRLKQQGV